MSIDLENTYNNLEELEKLINKFIHSNQKEKKLVNIHINEVKNWLIRIENIQYPIANELGIEKDNHNLECPLCSGEDMFCD